MRSYPFALTALGLFTACLSASSVAAQRSNSRSNTASSDDPFTWSGTLKSGATLRIKNFNGPVDVRAGSGDRVEVRGERRSSNSAARNLTFEVRHEGDDVTICSVWRGDSACDDGRHNNRDDRSDDGNASSGHITVTLPKGARVDANTGNGAISVVDAGGDVTVNTGNGDLRVEGTAGRVHANTGNGAVVITGATGRVHATTGNGRVNVSTSTGPVDVNTGSGDIDVRLATLPKDSDMEFRTGNGHVVVTVPASIDADFDASTGNGSVHSDFDVVVRGSLNPRHIHGTIGHGGGSIHISTGNGSVELRKAN
jgi:DUF4097 and DUF4098 domain-containing protein YvlB